MIQRKEPKYFFVTFITIPLCKSSSSICILHSSCSSVLSFVVILLGCKHNRPFSVKPLNCRQRRCFFHPDFKTSMFHHIRCLILLALWHSLLFLLCKFKLRPLNCTQKYMFFLCLKLWFTTIKVQFL